MRFACPHCGEPTVRPMVRSISGWVEYTGSGSSWHCSELHCSECHKPVVIEPQTPEERRRVYEDHENLTLLRKQTDRLASWILTNVPGEPSRDEGAIAVAIRLLESWRPKEMNESGQDRRYVAGDSGATGGATMSEPKLLHVHAQGAHHDPVHIVGNRAGLEALKTSIMIALDDADQRTRPRPHSEDVQCADGEHYNVHVHLDDSPWNGPTWPNRAEPYTADYARENRTEAIWP